MKLLVFCAHYPPFVGGLETHAAEFNQHMAEESCVERITVFTSHIPSSSPLYERQDHNIDIFRFPAFEIIPNYPVPKFWHPRFWSAAARVHRQGSTIVISRTRFFFTSFMALVYAKIWHKKHIHIEHGSDFVHLSSPLSSSLARIYDYTLGRLVLRMSTQTIAISESVKNFVHKFDTRSVPVVHRGVEIGAIDKIEPGLESQALNGVPVIAFLGRLIDGKGVADLVEVLGQMTELSWQCWILGGGSQYQTLTRRVLQLGLDERIIFWGEKPRDTAIAFIKQADIFVNPSYGEGLPTSVIEAALSHCAIVATDVGGTNEIISDGENGLLVQAGDRDMLREAIRRLLGDVTLRKQLGNKASERAHDEFSWEHSIREYVRIFQGVK